MFPPNTALWERIADGRTLLPEFSLANMMAYFVTRKVCDGQNAGDFKHLNNHSAISSDGLFTYESGCFLSTYFRSAGSFLGVFSCTKQNFVGIDPGFKMTREEPGIFLKQWASKWSPHSLECSLTGVFVRRIFASHLERSSLFSSGNRCQDFLIFMSEEFVLP